MHSRSRLQWWGQTTSDLCDCKEIQTMSHIVDDCPLTKFKGGPQALNGADEAELTLQGADEAAVEWLSMK